MPEDVADPKPINAVGRTVLVVWALVAALVVIVGIVIAVQVFRGFNEFGQPGLPGGGSSCSFDHEPTDQELQACMDATDPSSP